MDFGGKVVIVGGGLILIAEVAFKELCCVHPDLVVLHLSKLVGETALVYIQEFFEFLPRTEFLLGLRLRFPNFWELWLLKLFIANQGFHLGFLDGILLKFGLNRL